MTFTAGVIAGAVMAMALGWSLDWYLRRFERRLIRELLTLSYTAHDDFAKACEGLIDLYEETQDWMPHRFGAIELRKKILTDWATATQARADALREASKKNVSHSRARELVAQIDTSSERLSGWGGD